MKLIILRHLSNHLLKCAAIALSFLCWLYINYNNEVICSMQAPLLFDHVDEMLHTITAPETITLHLRGTRGALFSVSANTSAIHIDARDLIPGTQEVAISHESIFLPDFVSMLNYSPCKITVQ